MINFTDVKSDADYLLNIMDNLKQTSSITRHQYKAFEKMLSKKKQKEELKPYQGELIKMQKYLEVQEIPMIILFEGRDASGKSGTIRRIVRNLNPKHYHVVSLGKPTEAQKQQWYFQRYIEHFPSAGEIVLFDRSWYTRALTEPIFGFCSPQEYQTFIQGVVDFEKNFINQGIPLIKFYFSVSKEVQNRRFEKRKTNILKKWKLSEIDAQAQDKWHEFSLMKYEMLRKTNTHLSPWIIIRSDVKHDARINTIKVILNSIKYSFRDDRIDFSVNKKIVIPATKEIEEMSKSGFFNESR